MKYVKQTAVILLMAFLGEVLNRVLPLPIPASIYGMVLMFLCLQTGVIKLAQIEETANFFLNVMPIFFISSTVKLIDTFGYIKDDLLGLTIICTVSTILVMAVTGLVSQVLIRWNRKKEEPKS